MIGICASGCSTLEQLKQRFSNASDTLLIKKYAYHHQAYGLGRTWTPHWRCSIFSKWGWSQTRCFWHHSWRRRLCTKVRLRHLTGRQDRYPVARICFMRVWAVMCLPKTQNHLHPQMRSRSEMDYPDHREQVMVFTGHIHLLSTTILLIIRSTLLSIAPQDLNNTFLRHTQHSRHLTLRIALCWQQDDMLQNVLWQISWHDAPINMWKHI